MNALSTSQSTPLKINSTTVSLLHVKDAASGALFLIDTGVEVSIIPPKTSDLSRPPGIKLVVANGSKIKSFGTRWMALKINQFKYIGADFLRTHGLLVDIARDNSRTGYEVGLRNL